jgi:hypothetical protein
MQYNKHQSYQGSGFQTLENKTITWKVCENADSRTLPSESLWAGPETYLLQIGIIENSSAAGLAATFLRNTI